MKTISIYLLLILAHYGLNAQDFKKDFMEAATNTYTLNNYSLLMHYKLYVDDKQNKPFQERKMFIKHFNEKVYVKEDNGLEIVYNGNYEITVNAHDKTMQASKTDVRSKGKKNRELNALLNMDPGKFLKLFDGAKLLFKQGDKLCYELAFKGVMEVEKAKIVINTRTKLFESVTYNYRNKIKVHEIDDREHKVKLEIIYKDFEINTVKDDLFFDESRYLQVVNGKTVATSRYPGYTLKLFN